MVDHPAGAIRLQVREADEALIVVCPNALAHWYFDTHPSVGYRVALLQNRPDPCLKPRP
jgi:hypothetical protein